MILSIANVRIKIMNSIQDKIWGLGSNEYGTRHSIGYYEIH